MTLEIRAGKPADQDILKNSRNEPHCKLCTIMKAGFGVHIGAQTSHKGSAAKRGEVQDEPGDLLIYAARLTDRLDIDIIDAAHRKHNKNKDKYPADKVRGSAAKYTEYQEG